MTVKTDTRKRGNDWQALELEFMDSPWLTLVDLSKVHDIPQSTVQQVASNGGWLKARDERYKKIHAANLERMAGILAEGQNDDISSFRALEDRVKRLALASLELIIPPDDAPLQAQMAAQIRLQAMSAKQLSEIINQSLRTLTETGRHKRLLNDQATVLFGRATAPDVLVDEPLESAQALETRSRMAQKALRASISGEPLDVDYDVLASPEHSAPIPPIPPESPEVACPRSVPPIPPVPPISHNAQDTVVSLDCVTSKGQADDVPLGGL